MEGHTLPFYGVQWHPEAYINPSSHSVAVSQALANFFVGEARKSDHRFANATELWAAAIQNCRPLRPTPELVLSQTSLFIFDTSGQCPGWSMGQGSRMPPLYSAVAAALL